jgi:phosphoglycolate phosphatase-like HAD superfamily hydrolase
VLATVPAELLYVGDQRQDFDAAARAGTRFLGVSYGWGIDATDRDFDTVGTPLAIAAYVRARRPAA